MSGIAARILATFCLLALGAFFAAAAFAIVRIGSVTRNGAASAEGLRGRFLAKVLHNLEASVTTARLGFAAAALGLGWLAGPLLARLLGLALAGFGVPFEGWLAAASVLMAFAALPACHWILGELLPRSLANRSAKAVALWASPPLWVVARLAGPAVRLAGAAADGLLR